MSPEHAALRADIEITTNKVMEQLYRTISAEIKQLFAENDVTSHYATNELSKQISSLGTRVTQVQQQLVSTERRSAPSAKPSGARAPTDANPKQGRRRKEKRANNNNADNNEPNTTTNTRPTTRTYADAAKTPTAQPQSPTEQTTHATNVEGCENLRKRSQGRSQPHPSSSRPCTPRLNVRSRATSQLKPPQKPPPVPNEATVPVKPSLMPHFTESTKPWSTTKT